jgi:hypothetical protein
MAILGFILDCFWDKQELQKAGLLISWANATSLLKRSGSIIFQTKQMTRKRFKKLGVNDVTGVMVIIDFIN